MVDDALMTDGDEEVLITEAEQQRMTLDDSETALKSHCLTA